MVIQKGVKVSSLSGAESVMGQRGKLEFCALLSRKSLKSLVSWYQKHSTDSFRRLLKTHLFSEY